MLQWGIVTVCGVIWGLSKSGVHGISVLAIPVMAFIFGSKVSTGVVLPMLIIADIMAVSYYNRHANWGLLLRIMPWAIVGVILGTVLGDRMEEWLFKRVMAATIIASIVLMVVWDRRRTMSIPGYVWFAPVMGIAAGFTTMVGNVAGAVVAIYLLAMRLPKDAFIGTSAWFFLLINLVKVPFHIWVWHTMSSASLALNIAMIPAIVVGFLLGVAAVKRIADLAYRRFVIFMTFLAALILLF